MNFFRRRWASWLSLAIAALASVTLFARANARVPSQVASLNASSCTFNGIELHGNVQVVDSFPDITVKETSSFPDLNVQWVSSFADDCGEWKEVSSFPDFTIQYVSSFADLEIKEVSSFPGIP